jgi:hypothetical protein
MQDVAIEEQNGAVVECKDAARRPKQGRDRGRVARDVQQCIEQGEMVGARRDRAIALRGGAIV